MIRSVYRQSGFKRRQPLLELCGLRSFPPQLKQASNYVCCCWSKFSGRNLAQQHVVSRNNLGHVAERRQVHGDRPIAPDRAQDIESDLQC